MGCVEVHLVQRRGVGGVEPTGHHEREGAVDIVCHRFVASSLGALCDELLVPLVDSAKVGKSATCEGPQQVERRGGLVVGPQ